ncbi:MAG: 4Fe-4S binding protein [Bacteroidales bacterium]|nr:4Fe-4S binding protein [Bacteroidales bacterium]
MKNNWKILQVVTLGLLLCALAFLLVEHSVSPDNFADTWWMRMFPITVAINILFILLAAISMLMSSKWGNTQAMRIIRYVLLGASVAYLGFVRGGCPCVVSYFQNAVLFLLGKNFMVSFFVPFVVLLLLTYIYGKVWCGWLCPLGGLQDLIYLGRWPKLKDSKLFKVFKTKTAQVVMRSIQVVALIVLLIVLIIKQMPLYCRIDPFKPLFRLAVHGGLMWALVVLLVGSSLLIYRPFCKAFCPAGLLLNLVSLIPGARRVRIDSSSCKHCKRCEKKCQMSAISDDKVNHTCIHCGECLGTKCPFLKR